jgi:membrane protein
MRESLRLLLRGRGGRAGLMAAVAGPAKRNPLPAAKTPHDNIIAQTPRGDRARTAPEAPAHGWWESVTFFAAKVAADRVLTEAGSVAFFALLAIFPALAALISLYGLVADARTVSDHLASLAAFLPGGGMDIIKEQARSLTSGEPRALGMGVLFGFAASLWSANQGITALFDALNVVNGETDPRGFVHRTCITLTITFGALVFVVVAMTAVVILPLVLAFLGLTGWADFLVRVGRWPLLLGLTAAFLELVYRFGPHREKLKWKWLSWGSASASISWLIGSAAFSWYLAHFSAYNTTYGSLGAAIGFITWIWISATIILLGGELNVEMGRRRSPCDKGRNLL